MSTVDFDRFLAEERAGRPGLDSPAEDLPSLRVGGVVYALPRELPAIVGLHIIRQKRSAADEVAAAPEALNAIGEALFGPAAFAEILINNQLSIPELGALITAAFGAYQAVVVPAPNPVAPAREMATATST